MSPSQASRRRCSAASAGRIATALLALGTALAVGRVGRAVEPAPSLPATTAPTLSYLTTLRQFSVREPSADRDEPALVFGTLGRHMLAMGGGNVVLVGVTTPAIKFGLTLSGFIELSNFTPDAMPWQLFRAHFGLGTVWESPWINRRLPRGGSLFLDFGWFHESDHAVDEDRFVARYFRIPDARLFDNGNFSSYEYFKLKVGYRQALLRERLILAAALGGRFFTPSIDSHSVRDLQAGVLLDGRLTVHLVGPLYAFAAAFFEWIANGYVAAEQGNLSSMNHTPLRNVYVDLGIDLRSEKQIVLSLVGTYANSHGRGIDFFVDYGNQWGIALRIVL